MMGTEQQTGGGLLSGSKRRTSEQWTGSASVLLLALIVGMINYLAFRHYERFDVTSAGMFTLSEKTQSVLRELSSDIDIYLFMSRGEGSFQQTDELLKRYQAASPHILVHYVDAEREEAEFRLLAQRFGIMAAVTESGDVMADVAAVVARGEKHWHISRDDLIGLEFGPLPGEDEVNVNVKAEQSLTGGLLQVLRGKPTHACVAEGHGEWSLEEQAERPLSTLRFHLRHDNIEWQPLKTLGLTDVPDSCDAVLVLGPEKAFASAEVQALQRYLEHGGNVLLALDPIIERDEIQPSGFEAMLEQRGVRLDATLVVELSDDRLVGQNPAEFVVTDFNDHEITRRLQGQGRVIMALVRSVSPTGKNAGVTSLLRTSEQSYGETDPAGLDPSQAPEAGPGDVPGPASLGVALRVPQADAADEDGSEVQEAPGGRLVVLGDSDFLIGPLLDTPELSNFDLAAAAIGYVTERQALIAIAPKTVKGGQLVLSRDDLSGLFFRVTVLMPGAALLLGIGVWLSRRA